MPLICPSIAANSRQRILAAALLGLCVMTWGCRDSGPRRYPVAGQVTFRGNPVPAGRIQFLPDTQRGNHGPAGFAAIENGRYDTRRGGRGMVGGPHVAVITGYDRNSPSDADGSPGMPLFLDSRVPIDLPSRATQHDFHLPTGP